MKLPVHQVVYISLFIALHIVLSRLTSLHLVFGGVEYTRVGLGAFPIIFGGILLGPRPGMIIGALGDIVGYHLNPMGPYLPQFTAIAALEGLLPGLMFRLLRYKPGLGRFGGIIAVTKLICSVLLTPYTLWSLFKIPIGITVPQRLLALMIIVPAFAYFANILYSRLAPILGLYLPQPRPELVRARGIMRNREK